MEDEGCSGQGPEVLQETGLGENLQEIDGSQENERLTRVLREVLWGEAQGPPTPEGSRRERGQEH